MELQVSWQSAGVQLWHIALQVVATLVAVAGTAMALANVSGPGAVILGGGLALSSTAVAMQVLQDRGESGSRHGRATFAVLLLQASAFCCKKWNTIVYMLQPTNQSINQSINQSRILQLLEKASPFDLIAVFHQKLQQTKGDADRHSHHQEIVFLHEANKVASSRHVNNEVVLCKLLLRLTLRDKLKPLKGLQQVHVRLICGSQYLGQLLGFCLLSPCHMCASCCLSLTYALLPYFFCRQAPSAARGGGSLCSCCM